MVRIETLPDPPTSQAGLEARLDAVVDELDVLCMSADGRRARSYLRDALQAALQARTLARQGL